MIPIAKTLYEALHLFQQGNKRILCVEFALDLRNEREKVCTTEDEARAFFAVQ